MLNLNRKLQIQKKLYLDQKAKYKNYNPIFHIIRYGVGLFFIIICYFISPLLLVRFGSVRTRTFGDMCREINNSIYFGSNVSKKCLDLRYFYVKYPGAISNTYLYSFLQSKFIFLPAYILSPVLFWAKKYKFLNQHVLPYMCGRTNLLRPGFKKVSKLESDEHFRSSGLKTLLPDYEIRANLLLKSLALEDKKLIGIHVRDLEWQKRNLAKLSNHPKLQKQFDSIQKFESNSVLRNSSLLNFLDAIRSLDKQNYKCIRFGNPSKLYPENIIKPLIDFGNSIFSNNETDILLMGKMRYLICSNSGLSMLAHWMRVPVFLINIVDLYCLEVLFATINSVPIILPKEIRWKRDNELLTIKEIKSLELFKLPAEKVRQKIIQNESQIYFIENSPSTIQKTISLGHKYITTNEINEDVERGKLIYQSVYGSESDELSPILSPYWPNSHEKV